MANKKNNITFSDIAKYTNFSKTTISRYFNHPETLTEQNRNIIAEALEKLNYKENNDKYLCYFNLFQHVI